MIIHLDFDCFFVSAERTRYAPFRGAAAAVVKRNDAAIFGGETIKTNASAQKPPCASSGKFDGGDWRSHFLEGSRARGVVIAASYEARSFDVKTGTTLCEALRRCPKLRVLGADLPFYTSLSNAAAEFLEARVPVLERYSIDEFFGSLEGFIKEHEIERYLRNMQADLYKELRLPASIGAGANRSIAKLASKSAKPFGVLIVKDGDINGFINDKPIKALAGIGQKTGAYLERYGVRTLGDALRSPSLLTALGKNGRDLLRELQGERIALETDASERKQIGISRVFDPIFDRAEALRRLYILCGRLAYNIARSNKEPLSFTFIAGYEIFPNERVKIRADRPFSEKLLRQIAKEAFKTIDKNPSDAINYLAVSAGDFNDKPVVYGLFSYQEDRKNRRIDDAALKARSKYGYAALTYAKAT
ncbi:MAG: hypothetical protein LBF86_07500 [Helicobacteraceae bacterium]|jgi:DNA polymerase-4|nr:hypothetical protein [Helicobacteraceae bacterium]